MFRNTIRCPFLALLLIGTLALPLCSPALGQALPWQPGIASAQADDYYTAQQPPAPAPKPPAAKAPAAKPPIRQPEPEPTFDTSGMFDSQDVMMRLASVPNMFGDSFGMGGRVLPWAASWQDLFGSHSSNSSDSSSSSYTGADVASAGAVRRVKIAENNKALPMDRVYCSYNHFQNALQGSSFEAPPRDISLDQYTMGLEKTFRDGLWSCDLRMPFSGAYRYNAPDVGAGTGHFGNLAVTLKRRLYTTDTCLMAAGLGVSIPTGSDGTGHVNRVPYVLHNDTVALLPWVGFLSDRFDPLFVQGFLQVDVPLNGDRVRLGDEILGKYNEQTLMYLDLEMGYWLFRNRNGGLLTAMAAMLEFHYTTTLQNTDLVAGSVGGGSLSVVNVANRVDVVNMTVGLHTEITELTHLSVGAVFPLDIYPDRFFDSEIQVFLNRYY